MARFQSREEYERWRASQESGVAPEAATDEQPGGEEAPAAEQIYDGPAPGSQEFASRASRQAGMGTDRDRNLAMLCHLSALSGFVIPFGNLFGPLVFWMLGKKDSQFVDDHGKSSLNFQISLTLFIIVGAVVSIFLGPLMIVFFLVAGIVAVYAVVMSIVNGIKAHNGDEGEYALSSTFLH